MMTWIGDEEGDMEWLHSVHGVPADMTCAILYGDEDYPRRIEAWREYNPHYETKPDYVWEANR